jgi:hypothetical protein
MSKEDRNSVTIIEEHLRSYTFEIRDTAGRRIRHTPNVLEQAIMLDLVLSLLERDDFVRAIIEEQRQFDFIGMVAGRCPSCGQTVPTGPESGTHDH